MRAPDACSIVLSCAVLGVGCAVPRPSTTSDEVAIVDEVAGPGSLFDVVHFGGDDAARISTRLLAAGPRLSRWGTFHYRVRIRVLPDHAALENQIGLHGYPWLRAWAF